MDSDKYFTEAENKLYHMTADRDKWRKLAIDSQIAYAQLTEEYQGLERKLVRVGGEVEHLTSLLVMQES
jgi:hypothetical protein